MLVVYGCDSTQDNQCGFDGLIQLALGLAARLNIAVVNSLRSMELLRATTNHRELGVS
jgi:hypothetical protein